MRKVCSMINVLYIPSAYYHNNSNLIKSILSGRELLKVYGSDLDHNKEEIIIDNIRNEIVRSKTCNKNLTNEEREYYQIIEDKCNNYMNMVK